MAQQDAMLSALRRAERMARMDSQSVKRAMQLEAQQQFVASQTLSEVEQNLVHLQKSLESEKQRGSELKLRCDELSSELERERKLR